MSNKERLNLLTDAEVSDLYSIPIFSDDNERDHFFTLDDAEHKLLKKYTSIKSKVYLIIQIGYFKAIQQFYKFSLDDVKDDVNFIHELTLFQTVRVRQKCEKLIGHHWLSCRYFPTGF